jgi:hypothetical protein
VREYTEANLPRWREHPEQFSLRTEAYFRVRCMADVFAQRLGLRFHPETFDLGLYPRIGDTFLFGLTATRSFTYETAAVLFAAVGRRLGYPIRLATATWRSGNLHVFARWDERGGERLNLTLDHAGLRCPPTDFYRDSTDFLLRPGEEQSSRLLRSMTAREELALFLVQRGRYWRTFGRRREGVEAFAWASALHPENVAWSQALTRSIVAWHADLERLRPPRIPEVWLDAPQRRFPETLPAEVEQDVLLLEATEALFTIPELEGEVRRRAPGASWRPSTATSCATFSWGPPTRRCQARPAAPTGLCCATRCGRRLRCRRRLRSSSCRRWRRRRA